MEYDVSWSPEYLEPVLSMAAATIALVGYWFTVHWENLRLRFVKKHGESEAKIRWVLFWRLAGFFFYVLIGGGIVIAATGNPISRYGFSFQNSFESLLWILGFSLVLIIAQSRGAKHPSNYKLYPQIRVAEWTPRIYFSNLLAWLLYMISYEFLFRGILLFGCMHVLGVWPAILINIGFYSLAHVPKGSKEAWLAIPFGLVICLLTLKTGTIWIAVFVHLALAASNDYFAIRANPETKFKF